MLQYCQKEPYQPKMRALAPIENNKKPLIHTSMPIKTLLRSFSNFPRYIRQDLIKKCRKKNDVVWQ